MNQKSKNYFTIELLGLNNDFSCSKITHFSNSQVKMLISQSLTWHTTWQLLLRGEGGRLVISSIFSYNYQMNDRSINRHLPFFRYYTNENQIHIVIWDCIQKLFNYFKIELFGLNNNFSCSKITYFSHSKVKKMIWESLWYSMHPIEISRIWRITTLQV